MQHIEHTGTGQEQLEGLIREAGVEDLMELYRKVEEVYVAAHGAATSVPLDVSTDSTNLSAGNT